MNRLFLIALIVVSLSCTSAPVDPDPAETRIPDAEIGLSGHTVFEDPAQQPAPANEAEPGESLIRQRSFPQAPPVISHSTAGFEPITASENLCLDCHDVAAASDIGATATPPSHYRDLRNAPEVKRDEIAGARYYCTICHVAQTGAVPLVEVRRP
jgi:cytochrome c-type protein NapB